MPSAASGPSALIVLSGLPGTGKSAVADAVAAARGLPVVSVDPIESAMLRAGIGAGFERGLAAYAVAETLARAFLAAGLDPVIDAVNSVERARATWRSLAAEQRVRLAVIECVLSDATVHRARLSTRARGLALPEPTWEEVDDRREEWAPWLEPHLTLDAMADLGANVAAALAYVDAVRRPES